MAIKKSDLYSSLWASCDELRGEYGKALITQLAKDLTLLLGRGFSRSNLVYKRLLYLRYPIIVLTEMDEELAMFEARRDKTCNIKQAMMQELLTGKTRLV